jgi:hypothetical protein
MVKKIKNCAEKSPAVNFFSKYKERNIDMKTTSGKKFLLMKLGRQNSKLNLGKLIKKAPSVIMKETKLSAKVRRKQNRKNARKKSVKEKFIIFEDNKKKNLIEFEDDDPVVEQKDHIELAMINAPQGYKNFYGFLQKVEKKGKNSMEDIFEKRSLENSVDKSSYYFGKQPIAKSMKVNLKRNLKRKNIRSRQNKRNEGYSHLECDFVLKQNQRRIKSMDMKALKSSVGRPLKVSIELSLIRKLTEL